MRDDSESDELRISQLQPWRPFYGILSALFAVVGLLGLATCVFSGFPLPVAGFAAACFAMVWFWGYYVAAEVTVGTEQLTCRSLFRTRTFPFPELRALEPSRHGAAFLVIRTDTDRLLVVCGSDKREELVRALASHCENLDLSSLA